MIEIRNDSSLLLTMQIILSKQMPTIALVSSNTEHILGPRKRRLHDRNLSSRQMPIRAGSRKYLDYDLTLTKKEQLR